MAERDWAEQVQQILEEAAEPVRVKLASIQTALDTNEAEHKRLVQARREVTLTLNRLVPPRRETKKKSVTLTTRLEDGAKLDLVRNWLVDHRAKYSDGFTAAQIHRDLRAKNGKGEIGPSAVLEIVKGLHEAGFVRADKKVRGGAMSYKLVSA